jgi:hypothetical protein
MSACEAVSQNVLECPRGENCLNDKQHAAIELLILGQKTKDVASAVGVERRTVTRWKVDENFREELDRRRRELWSRASQRIASLVHPAIDVLEKHLNDRYEGNRFRAASAVLRLVDLKQARGIKDCGNKN